MLIPPVGEPSLVTIRYTEGKISTCASALSYAEFVTPDVIEPPYQTVPMTINDASEYNIAGLSFLVVFQRDAKKLQLPLNETLVTHAGNSNVHGSILVCKTKNFNPDTYISIKDNELDTVVKSTVNLAMYYSPVSGDK